MPPNFCPSCGGQVADRKTVECASCGHDFEDDVEFDDEVDEEDDDFFDDDEDDDSFTDTPTDDRPAQRKSTIEMSRSSVVQSTTTLAVPDGGQLHTSSSFWNTITGKILRWFAYLPIAIILLTVIELLTALFFIWFFAGNMRMFVIVGILFGGIFLAWPLVIAYYGVIVLANKMVCPSPRVGVIIFATIYFLGFILPAISIYTSDFDVETIVTLTLLKILFVTTTFFSVLAIYSEEH